MINFKGSQFEREILVWGVRWYVAYPISYRQLEEMMSERGVTVDHSTLNRWVIKYAPEVENAFRRRQRLVGRSWRLDETYVKIKGTWAYLYRAVDTEGQTIDFLLTPQRDRDAAEAFVYKAMRTQGLPEKIAIDQRGSNTAAIMHYNRTHRTALVMRHAKYLNNLVEQDHRAGKRIPCWVSSPFGRPAVRSRAWKSGRGCARGSWRPLGTAPERRQSSFILAA